MRLLKPLNSSHLRWLHLKPLTSLKWLHLCTELVSHYHNCLSQKRLKIDKKHTWWKSSMSISASAFHDFSSETQKRCKASTREMTSPIITMQNIKLYYWPEAFSWNMTLVSLRKFFPMMKTSSPPLTEQLCSDFFSISGTPAGWAVNTADTCHAFMF